MKIKLSILILYLCPLLNVINGQDLKFNNNNQFKIIQFTDLHFEPEDSRSKQPIQVMRDIIEVENPDLVILTGDIVTGNPIKEGWDAVMSPIVKKDIPYAVIFGNHDDEQGLTRKETAKIATSYNGCVNKVQQKGVSGVLNDAITIRDNISKKPRFIIYLLDSHSYSKDSIIEGYAWVEESQINWYKQESIKLTNSNNGIPLPALAFLHIPLPEHRQSYFHKKGYPIGERTEEEYLPEVNSGLYYAFHSHKDVFGIFSGHNHNNSYIANLHGISLGFGRFSGGKNTYTYLSNGARVIMLTAGQRSYETWIRLSDGTIKDIINFPKDFHNKND